MFIAPGMRHGLMKCEGFQAVLFSLGMDGRGAGMRRCCLVAGTRHTSYWYTNCLKLIRCSGVAPRWCATLRRRWTGLPVVWWAHFIPDEDRHAAVTQMRLSSLIGYWSAILGLHARGLTWVFRAKCWRRWRWNPFRNWIYMQSQT